MEFESILRSQTMNMYSDDWYNKTSLLLQNKSNKDGYVYFIKNGKDSKYVKVGATSDVGNRIFSYKTSFEKGVFLLGYIKTNNPFLLEKEIHEIFKEQRYRGEFFKISNQQLYTIKEVFDLNVKNDYVKNKNIEQMNENNLLEDFDINLIELVKSLEIGKQYTIKKIKTLYFRMFKIELSKSDSWIGRDVNNISCFLGMNKKTIIKNGKRYFVLK